jgi:hypothetical protein
MKKVILSVMVAGTLLATGCKKAAEAGKDMKDATVEAANTAADATKDAATTVVDGAKDAANTAVDATKDAATTVVDGAKDATNAVVDGAKNMADKATSVVESAIGGVSIPEFKNPEVTKHLQSYATYAKDYIAAKGDVLKSAKLAKQGVSLATKGKELLGSLDAESATKFKSVMNAIQSKMAPAK